MNYIERLIQEHCPGGVEWKKLEEIFELKNGYTPSKANSSYWTDGTIPWFRMEDIRTNGRILSDSLQHITPEAVKGGKLFPANSFLLATTATIGEHALIIADSLANQQFTNLTVRKSLADKVDVKFMYHYMFIVDEWCKKHTNVSGFASVDMPKLKKLEIPLPPLPVQRAIAEVLDKFSALEAELEAELEARRVQYEYYREQLLTAGEDAEWVTLGEVGTFTYGYTDKAKKEGDARLIRITDITDEGNLAAGNAVFVDKSETNSKYLTKTGDLLVARTGASFGKTLYVPNDEPSIYASFLIKITLDNNLVDNRFYWHFSKSGLYWSQANKLVSVGGQQQFNAPSLAKIKFPLPPLPRQREIASILDRFEMLTTSLSAGLPAELEMRRKQYEHYREQMFSSLR